EKRAEGAHLDTVENVGGLAEREVAGRPGMGPREVPGKEPLGGPRPEAAERRDPLADVVVLQRSKRVQVDIAAREPNRVLGLPARESDSDELLLRGGRDPLPCRESPCHADGCAETDRKSTR